VTSLDRDHTHDVDVTLDNDGGLLRLLITVSDTRLTGTGGESTPCHRRPTDHQAAAANFSVRPLTRWRPLLPYGYCYKASCAGSG